MALKLDRSVSSVSDEIKENSVNGVYNAEKANFKAYQKDGDRRFSAWRSILIRIWKSLSLMAWKKMTNLRLECLADWSMLRPAFSTLAVRQYTTLFEVQMADKLKEFVLKAVHKKGGPKRGTPITIDGRTTIDERPKKIDSRLEFGHFEGDSLNPAEMVRIASGLDRKKNKVPISSICWDRTTANINRIVEEILFGLPVQSLTSTTIFPSKNTRSFQNYRCNNLLLSSAVSTWERHHRKSQQSNTQIYQKEIWPFKVFTGQFTEVERKLRDRFMECLKYKTPREAFSIELQKQRKPLVRGMIMEKLLVN